MKKKIITSVLLAMVLMMLFSVTAFAESFSVAGGGLQTSIIENDTHVYSNATDQTYYVTVSSSSNYYGSRAWNATSNIYASARISGSGNTPLLYSARSSMIRYRGFATDQNLSWSASGHYSVS